MSFRLRKNYRFQLGRGLVSKFQDLSKLIAKAQLHFTTNPEAEALKNIAHDCQIMIDFVNSIDLADLQDMFIKIKK